jgi:3D (Asp-Asp-Asp) domain-containing protein
MNLASMALMGLFAWSSFGTASMLTPSEPTIEPAKPVASLMAAAEKTFPVAITGYNAVPEQTDSDPYTTAWGIYSNPEIVAAVSQDLRKAIPYGTVVVLEAENPTGPHCGFNKVKHLIGYRVVADTMNARHTDRMDILFDIDADVAYGSGENRRMVNAAKVLASCGNITARVVGKVSIKDIPETQAELAMRVETTLAAR